LNRRMHATTFAALLAMGAIALPAAAVTAADPLVARTTQQGVVLTLRVPAGPWEPGQRIDGTVTVKNTNDRKVWYLATGCRLVGVEVRLPTDPADGRDWSAKRGQFKRLALSTVPDLGPVVDHFTVEGLGDCAEPVPEALAAGASRTRDVSVRLRKAAIGAHRLDVSAVFAFQGFHESDADWQDYQPAPMSASVRVAFDDRPSTLISVARALDIALDTTWVHNQIRDSHPDAWIKLDMELSYRSSVGWQWRVDLFEDVGDPQDQARIVVGFVVNARSGVVSTD